jgi:sugar lactone lactonase YvrE
MRGIRVPASATPRVSDAWLPSGPGPARLLAPVLLALVACGGGDTTAPDVGVVEVTDVGFQTPASILADTVADVYLVSNIVGRPGDRDGTGFISRISPDGEMISLRWIDPEGTQNPLHSPGGMGIRGDSLFVADLNCVRIFLRTTGTSLARVCIEDATYITDLDVGPEGSVFVAESGLMAGPEGLVPSGTDAVFRLALEEGRRGSTLARGTELGRPSGIAVGRRGIFVTTSQSGEIFRLTPEGQKTSVFPRSDRHLGGIVFLADGGFAFSSRTDSAVFMVNPEGRVIRLKDDLAGPAGIGYDPRRNRILVPVADQDRVVFLDLP